MTTAGEYEDACAIVRDRVHSLESQIGAEAVAWSLEPLTILYRRDLAVAMEANREKLDEYEKKGIVL